MIEENPRDWLIVRAVLYFDCVASTIGLFAVLRGDKVLEWETLDDLVNCFVVNDFDVRDKEWQDLVVLARVDDFDCHGR